MFNILEFFYKNNKVSINTLVVAIVAFSVPLSALLYVFLGRDYLSVGGDFLSYFVGAKIVVTGNGRYLYDLSTQYFFQTSIIGPGIADWVLPFRGLPVVLLLYLPLTIFSLKTAYLIFSIFNFLLLGLLFYSIVAIFRNVYVRAKYLFLLVVVYLPLIQTLWMGQLSILLTLIFLLIYKNIRDKKYLVAGILSSLIVVKAQYFVSVPFLLLLINKKKSFLAGFIPSLALMILTSTIMSSPSWLFNYPKFLLETENPGYGSRFNEMMSFFANVRFLFPTLPGGLLMFFNATLYLVTILLFKARSGNSTMNILFISTMFFSVVFSIHFLSFDYTLLLIPFYILFDVLFKTDDRRFSPMSILAFLIYAIPGLTYVGLKPYLSFPIMFLGFLFLFWNNNWKRSF